MNLKAVDFRKQSKNALTGKWGLAIGAYLLASLLGAFSSTINTFNIDIDIDELRLIFNQPQISPEVLLPLLSVLFVTAITGFVYSIALFCLGSIIYLGYAQFNLDIIDSNTAKIGTLFSYFKYWGNAIITNFLRTLYTFLWTLLFIIPGIIAAYSYSMTPYILAENPNTDPSDAITRSKEMMKGNKWRLFCLQISFIGWDILCVLTLGILSFWILPWKQATVAAFYRSLAPLPAEPIEGINNFGDFDTDPTEETTV